MKFLVFLFVWTVSFYIHADTITQYRLEMIDQLKNEKSDAIIEIKDIENVAVARIQEMKSLLKTNHLNQEILVKNKELFRETLDRNFKINSSQFFRRQMMKGIYYLADQKKKAGPLEVKQSWFFENNGVLDFNQKQTCANALDQSHSQERRLSSDGNIIGGVNDLISSFYKNVVTANDNEEDVLDISPIQNERVQILSKYIAQNYPLIPLKLGKIVEVKTRFGELYKIYFQNKSEEKISVSLEMLLGHLLGLDEAFVEINFCLHDFMKNQLKSFQENIQEEHQSFISQREFLFYLQDRRAFDKNFILDRINILKKSVPVAEEKLNGAIHVNELLKTLEKDEIYFLIDIFLTLVYEKMPIKSEIFVLQNLIERKVDELMATLNHSNRPDKKIQKMYTEFSHFELLSDLLYKLKEKLSKN